MKKKTMSMLLSIACLIFLFGVAPAQVSAKAVPANNRPSAPRRVIGIEGPSGPCFFNQNLRDKPNLIRGPRRGFVCRFLA